MSHTTPPDALPWAALNGRIVRARDAVVSVFDRSFLLGDGAFETIRVITGRPIQWRPHWARLKTAARHLEIRLPLGSTAALALAGKLIDRNRADEAVLRIHLSRGCGRRGYSPRGADQPLLAVTMFAADKLDPVSPGQARLGVATVIVPTDGALGQFKTASRVLNVLAKAQADAGGFDDALLLDRRGRVLEATGSNVFWFRGRRLVTPSLAGGILPGITRECVIRVARRLGIPVEERFATLAQIQAGAGAFLTVSTRGIIEVLAIAGRKLPRNPATARLHVALVHSWQREARHGSRPQPKPAST